MYKNTATYKNATELEVEAGNDEEYEMNGIRYSTVFAKESEAGQLREICLSGAASALTLSPLPGSSDGDEKLPGLRCLDFDI